MWPTPPPLLRLGVVQGHCEPRQCERCGDPGCCDRACVRAEHVCRRQLLTNFPLVSAVKLSQIAPAVLERIDYNNKSSLTGRVLWWLTYDITHGARSLVRAGKDPSTVKVGAFETVRYELNKSVRVKRVYVQHRPVVCGVYGNPLRAAHIDGPAIPTDMSVDCWTFRGDEREQNNHDPMRIGIVNRFLNRAQGDRHGVHTPCLREAAREHAGAFLFHLEMKVHRPEEYNRVITAATKALFDNGGWVAHMKRRIANTRMCDEAHYGGADSDFTYPNFAAWVERTGGICCDVSGIPLCPERGTFGVHLDRIGDLTNKCRKWGVNHNFRNLRIVATHFCHETNPSSEEFLELMLEQDLVPLSERDRANIAQEQQFLSTHNGTRKQYARHGLLPGVADHDDFAR